MNDGWYSAPTRRTWLLAPVSWLYFLITRAWHLLFDLGLRRPVKVDGATVISIGNIVVGGAGKTPLIIHLANDALANGRRVAILTRGYGRSTREPIRFDSRALPTVAEAGDEPRLIARRSPGVTVFVNADRVASARAAVKEGFDLLLLDDGFQHRRLARDVDLVLDVGVGNGFLLPAGPLREPVSALRRATHVWKRDVDVRYEVTSLIAPDGARQSLRGQRVVLLLGVARPDRVRRSVEMAGATVVAMHAHADHHVFTPEELAAATRVGATLVTTEKDAERLPPGTAHVLELTVTAPPLATLLSPRR
ncbi:MAG: tetraacyldisaccharide 4'-kinase [Archangium gephyra]|uniref:Tetraacyldisaccharide 4'-kinase n=1 Tax=Archangium gephyra TaxID=48 RepID=A0A2W5UBI2_9BACT|nr:MAG: tetraacyldisaccharide 4'-kinase [Archangium gephyra]